jgi:hypothetical protein
MMEDLRRMRRNSEMPQKIQEFRRRLLRRHFSAKSTSRSDANCDENHACSNQNLGNKSKQNQDSRRSRQYRRNFPHTLRIGRVSRKKVRPGTNPMADHARTLFNLLMVVGRWREALDSHARLRRMRRWGRSDMSNSGRTAHKLPADLMTRGFTLLQMQMRTGSRSRCFASNLEGLREMPPTRLSCSTRFGMTGPAFSCRLQLQPHRI